jgi:hypothetical protein
LWPQDRDQFVCSLHTLIVPWLVIEGTHRPYTMRCTSR